MLFRNEDWPAQMSKWKFTWLPSTRPRHPAWGNKLPGPSWKTIGQNNWTIKQFMSVSGLNVSKIRFYEFLLPVRSHLVPPEPFSFPVAISGLWQYRNWILSNGWRDLSLLIDIKGSHIAIGYWLRRRIFLWKPLLPSAWSPVFQNQYWSTQTFSFSFCHKKGMLPCSLFPKKRRMKNFREKEQSIK